jgi:murein DD-endopeptidase MepM/ murein hydrolase activator NlpD
LLDWAAALQWPARGRISGVYGSQRILNGQARDPHLGLDIAAPTGTAVIAPLAGTVRLAVSDMVLTGGTLLLDHGHGVSTIYIHLSRIDVREGQRVLAGEQIAAIGATGRASGPHLHFQVQWFQERLDPALLLEPR